MDTVVLSSYYSYYYFLLLLFLLLLPLLLKCYSPLWISAPNTIFLITSSLFIFRIRHVSHKFVEKTITSVYYPITFVPKIQ
jgi:hypothetical protein